MAFWKTMDLIQDSMDDILENSAKYQAQLDILPGMIEDAWGVYQSILINPGLKVEEESDGRLYWFVSDSNNGGGDEDEDENEDEEKHEKDEGGNPEDISSQWLEYAQKLTRQQSLYSESLERAKASFTFLLAKREQLMELANE